VSGTERQLRFVFSLLHAGYLRHYGGPLRILAERGHRIDVFVYHDDEAGGGRLLDALTAEFPNVTAARAPRRERIDGWRPIAWFVRALADVLRYSDPVFAGATALRGRAVAHLRERVRRTGLAGRLVDRTLTPILERPHEARDRRLGAVLRTLERGIPPSPTIDSLLRELRPDAVLASPVVEFGSPQVEFLKSASALGIPCAACVASWDNLTSKGLLRVRPDRVIVWNDVQRRELESLHGIDASAIVVTGAQKFDAWFERSPRTAAREFKQGAGLEPERPYVLYLCSSSFIAPNEPEFVRRWLAAVRRGGLDVGALVRPHPQNTSRWETEHLSDIENAVVRPHGGTFPDTENSRAEFYDAMFHSVAVVGVNTSAQIDAAIVGKPVLTIRDPAFTTAQDETIHFRYLLREHAGFVESAASLEEHVRQLRTAIERGPAPETAGFVRRFVRPHGLDRPVTPIVAETIQDVALLRVTPSSGSRVLRAVLTPAALLAALATRVRSVWRR
jgi:hypothetical protein